VTMAYGLRMGRLGASEECCIAHNVHLYSNLVEIPNVMFKYIYMYICIYILKIYIYIYIIDTSPKHAVASQ